MNQECCLKPSEKFFCTCSYEDRLELIGKKWALVILNLLYARGPLGYNALFAKISGITPKSLGDKLKLLEEKGLLIRSITAKPLRVTYQLTPEGKMLLESLSPFFNATKELRSS